MTINYFAPIRLFLGLKDRTKADVVTIASIASISRGNTLSSYVASKHAIYGYLNCVRTALSDRGVKNLTCSLACPYTTNTDMLRGYNNRLNVILPIQD
jgi:short-subunit dehydrogenase